MSELSEASKKTVSIIVVNLNGKDHLETLFASIATQSFAADRYEVILVDNGSTDSSLEFIEQAYPATRVIRNQQNEGFARPNNQAAALAHGHYLAFVNNDMKLEPDWLERMVAYLEAGGPDLACVSSKIVNWNGSRIDFIGGSLAFNGMGFQPKFQAPVDSPEAQEYPDELLFACGGAMLIDRKVYLEVGGFDEDFFAYFEDVDFGWRLWVQGYRIGFCPAAVAYHRHNGTSGRFGAHRKMVLFERNSLYTVIKNYDDASLARLLPSILLLSFKRMAVRSTIDRESFAFAMPSPPPSPLAPTQRTLLTEAVHYLYLARRLGVRFATRWAILQLAAEVQRRWLPPPPPPEGILIREEAYATVVGMEDLLDHLPKLMEKRALIQAKRKRSDEDIFRLFGAPFHPTVDVPDYVAAHERVLEHMGVQTYIQASLPMQRAEPLR